ncbi:MAG: hypothetical protein PHS89_09865 [Syntrophaceticus schinkii]|jgi:hypothetical protein|nr:hypothetical protein [Syntrophaceticus schinkii]MDD4262482.1 hypothetical protein [Syntrophaceticus schinkii]
MSFSPEIKEKIDQFAEEQLQHYLEEAEMTYMDKLRWEIGQTRSKIMAKLGKLKGHSETSLEVQNDMIIYMSNYMNDLIAEGFSEQGAFERAKEELKFCCEIAKSADLQERFAEHDESRDPADYGAVGLFYAGFLSFGFSIGALAGFLGSGGREVFLSGGWIDTLIGVAVGVIIGLGMGFINNAILVLKK